MKRVILGIFGSHEDGYQIEHWGSPKDDGGEGTVWSCSCQQGVAYANYQWSRLHGLGNVKVPPCRHLKSIFLAAKEGFIPEKFHLSAMGERAAASCGCIHAAGGLKPRPPKAPPAPPKPENLMSRNGPCFCGSGEKLKRCAPPGSPHHLRHIELTAPKKPEKPAKVLCDTMGPNGEGPCLHREGHVERGFSIHRDSYGARWVIKPARQGWFQPTVQWVYDQKKKLREREAQLDEILDRIHAKEEERRERARAKREAKKASKK